MLASQLVPGRVYCIKSGEFLEFSRIGGTGYAILHPPGDCDTQSSYAVKPDKIDREATAHETWECRKKQGYQEKEPPKDKEKPMDKKVWRFYTKVWRNKFLSLDANSIEDMADKLHKAAHTLEAMAQDGVKLDGGQDDDYARLVTTDPKVAATYGMRLEDEDCDEDYGGES